MTIAIHTLKFIGLSPLLQDNAAQMSNTNPGIKSPTKEDETPQQHVEGCVYRDGEGRLYHPSWALRRSLERGATNKKIGKLSAPGLVRAGVFPSEEEAMLIDPETGEPITEYEILTVTGVNKTTKGRIVVHRAKFPVWGAVVPFELDDDFIKVDHVLTLYQIAGRIAGIGAWRPEKSGKYGRYRVEQT